MSADDARSILLLAPAGYGKTTLLRQWMALNTDVAAISLDRSARDVAALAKEIALVLEPYAPGLSQRLHQLLASRSRPNREPQEIAREIVEAAANVVPALVFDDYHEIVGTASETLVEVLHETLDARLIVASRLRPSWATARRVVYGRLAEIDRDDLAMNEGEAAQMLSGAPASRRKLALQAEGWPAVLALAARSSRMCAPKDLVPTTLHRFFADELFGGLRIDIQQELVHLALLPQLAPSQHGSESFWSSKHVAETAVDLGFGHWVDDRLEMHPLIRDFLLTKLTASPNCDAEAKKAVSTALEHNEHDVALDLVTRFGLTDLLDALITASFRSFVAGGRIATVEEMAELSHRSGMHPSPLVDLLDAELLFRAGLHERAEHVAVRAAKMLTLEGHDLAARAWWLAGNAAHLLYEDGRARNHLLAARDQATDGDEKGEAIWGVALTTLFLEEPSLIPTVLDELESRKDLSAKDLVRWSSGNLMRARLGEGLQDTPSLELGLHAVQRLSDPHVRTGFLTLYAYNRALQADYAESIRVSHRLLEEAASYRLAFVRPHILMILALGLIGSRKLVEAEAALDEVENIDEGRDQFFRVNLSMLRARVALQERRLEKALDGLLEDRQDFPFPAIRAEYLALRGVVQAVSDENDGASRSARLAQQTSIGVEGTVLSAMALAVRAANEGDATDAVDLFDRAFRLNGGDGIVTALRASSPLLEAVRAHRSEGLAKLAERAGDDHLLRAAGRTAPTRRPPNSLSPREQEVGELLRAGLTNREISHALFISESTAKLHVRHILAKLAVRSRTEAAIALIGRRPSPKV